MGKISIGVSRVWDWFLSLFVVVVRRRVLFPAAWGISLDDYLGFRYTLIGFSRRGVLRRQRSLSFDVSDHNVEFSMWSGWCLVNLVRSWLGLSPLDRGW